MNNQKKLGLALILGFMILGANPAAQAALGHSEGNGGDICENRFKTIRDDIAAWIPRVTEGLALPSNLSIQEYRQRMTQALATAKINCIDDAVYVGGQQKTCKNFVDAKGVRQVVCDSRRFLQASESEQYVLTHHEYAGLAGIEVNSADGSQYFISNQLSAYLKNQMVKKLAVRPSTEPELQEGQKVIVPAYTDTYAYFKVCGELSHGRRTHVPSSGQYTSKIYRISYCGEEGTWVLIKRDGEYLIVHANAVIPQ